MEKYISLIISEEDIKVVTNFGDRDNGIRINRVFIEHIPTGMATFAEDISQMCAYNKALKQLEGMVKIG